MHGRKMGTHGGGARKKRKGSGHRGGKGMSGSGKRADHKKTLVTKLYGNTYFGKQGVTSRGTKRDKRKKINVGDVEAKFSGKGEIDLQDFKILGKGEVKNKLVIKAREASSSAVEKVEAKGGKIILKEKEKKDSAGANKEKDNKENATSEGERKAEIKEGEENAA